MIQYKNLKIGYKVFHSKNNKILKHFWNNKIKRDQRFNAQR